MKNLPIIKCSATDKEFTINKGAIMYLMHNTLTPSQIRITVETLQVDAGQLKRTIINSGIVSIELTADLPEEKKNE